jgi:predicted dehydrogenase
MPEKAIQGPDSRVRVALVGCGAAAANLHVPALLAVPGTEISCFCDRDLARADSLRATSHLRSAIIVDDYHRAAEHADAVVVATPPSTHRTIVLDLLADGLDVLCEKPLATSSADAREMADAARRLDRILAVGMVSRFNRANDTFRSLLRDPMVGEIQSVTGEMGSVLSWKMTTDAYLNKDLSGGGVLSDLGSHLIDRITWLIGSIDVSSYRDDSFGGVECNAFLDGRVSIDDRWVPCRLSLSWTHQLPRRIIVAGAALSLELSVADSGGLALVLDRPTGESRFLMHSESKATNPFVLQARDFVRAVRERSRPFVPAESVIESLTIIEKAYAMKQPIAQPWVTATGPLAWNP